MYASIAGHEAALEDERHLSRLKKRQAAERQDRLEWSRHGDEAEEEEAGSATAALELGPDELPSHGHSLAKWKLMQKSERK